MQTFVPESTFEECAKALDYRRLGKQRIEARQILHVLCGVSKGGLNHPAVKMWAGYENALANYYNVVLDEWERRGYRNNLPHLLVPEHGFMPPWWEDIDVHLSHQSNLIRKFPEFYRPQWPYVPDYIPYIWPEGNMEAYQKLVEYYKEKFG